MNDVLIHELSATDCRDMMYGVVKAGGMSHSTMRTPIDDILELCFGQRVDDDAHTLERFANECRESQMIGRMIRRGYSSEFFVSANYYKRLSVISHRLYNCNLRRYLSKHGITKIRVIVYRNDRYTDK